MKNKYDYDFMETRYILCCLINEDIEILDSEAYLKIHKMIVAIYTEDEELISIITDKYRPFKSIVKDVLQLNISRLLSKKPFHKYIEDNYPDSDYCKYTTLFEEYKVFIENNKNEALKIINQNITMAISNKERKENPEITKVKTYEIKGHLSSLLEETINQTIKLNEEIYKNQEHDNSILLNFLADCRIIWVDSIREKTGIDKVSLAFKSAKKAIKTVENKKGKYYFLSLASSLISIARIIRDSPDKKLYIVYLLIMAFNDVEIARALCTTKYKDVSVMDNRTFNNKLNHPLILDYLNTLAK